MSGLNQSGPMGQGPMTGRKMGRCTNSGTSVKEKTTESTGEAEVPSSENVHGRGQGPGRGGAGKGRGLGRQHRFRGGSSTASENESHQ